MNETCLYFYLESLPTPYNIGSDFFIRKNFWKNFPALLIFIKKNLKSKPVFKI